MSDIVERLRNLEEFYLNRPVTGVPRETEVGVDEAQTVVDCLSAAANEILRLRSELEQCQQAAFNAMEWQPIENLPESHKDGRKLIMWAPRFGLGALTLYWMDGNWREPKDGCGLSLAPTH